MPTFAVTCLALVVSKVTQPPFAPEPLSLVREPGVSVALRQVP
jgi:hypothetical protein